MNIARNFEGVTRRETGESFVLAHLVERRLLQRTARDNLTIRVNLVDHMRQAIQLSQAICRDCNLGPDALVDVHIVRHTVSSDYALFELACEVALDLVE